MVYDSIIQPISKKMIFLFVMYTMSLLPMVCHNANAQEWEWVKVADDGPPPLRQYAMAYDSIREHTVLFGGMNSSGIETNDTWEWDGNQWTKVIMRQKPSIRRNHEMVFDTNLGKIFMYGGWLGIAVYDDSDEMWAFDGVQWSRIQKDAANWPGRRELQSMTYVPNRGTVLHGGVKDGHENSANNETWIYDGDGWNNFTSSDRRALSLLRIGTASGMMAYDANRERVVLFGGAMNNQGEGAKNNTWEWDGENWQEIIPSVSPLPRSQGGMVYHPIRKTIIIFGGTSNYSSVFGDTWEWNGQEWKEIDIPSPEPRGSVKLVYDSAHDQIVMFGGRDYSTGKYYNDTWVLQSISSGISHHEWQMH